MTQSDSSVPRLLVLGGGALAMTAGLSWVGADRGAPPPQLAGLLEWWTDTGTAAAAISIVRGAGILVGVWTVMLAVVGLLAATGRSLRAVRIWSRLAPTAVRRLVATAAVVGVSAHAGAVAAAEPTTVPVPVLVDLGAAGDSTPRGTPSPIAPSPIAPSPIAPSPIAPSPIAPSPILVDLGPLAATTPDSAVVASSTEPDRWTVTAGDHLWQIAAETLADRGKATDTAHIAHYWQRLIDQNRAAIGPDVDLIHPGLVVQLPD